MLILENPNSWKQLQEFVALILEQCAFNVQIEKTFESIRSDIEIDVFAEEIVDNRKYKIICECKYWNTNIPQLHVHALRTVVNDIGANTAYIISTSNFQKGSFKSIEATNIELLTWEDFQENFFRSWYIKYFSPRLHSIITSKYDPAAIQFFEDYDLISRGEFSKLITTYNQLLEIASHFPHHIFKDIPNEFTNIGDKLPIIDKISQDIKEDWEMTNIYPPEEIILETNYSNFLAKIEALANSIYPKLDRLNLYI
jgi:hypothetical protein